MRHLAWCAAGYLCVHLLSSFCQCLLVMSHEAFWKTNEVTVTPVLYVYDPSFAQNIATSFKTCSLPLGWVLPDLTICTTGGDFLELHIGSRLHMIWWYARPWIFGTWISFCGISFGSMLSGSITSLCSFLFFVPLLFTSLEDSSLLFYRMLSYSTTLHRTLFRIPWLILESTIVRIFPVFSTLLSFTVQYSVL